MKTKLVLTYINDSENKVEALLEMPNDPDFVIAKMKIKVGDQEITGSVKSKEKARETYEDAISGGHQAGLLEMKDDQEEKFLQMRVGNIEPKQVIEVTITLIEQAKIFEGAYQITIPRGLLLLLMETGQNTDLQINLNCSSPITSIFAPALFKRTDHGLAAKKGKK